MHGLRRMSELMPEWGAVLDKHRKKPWEQNSLPCGFIQCSLSHDDKDWDRRKRWQIPATANLSFFLTKKKIKARRHCFFFCFLHLFVMFHLMSKQIETQARHSHFFFCLFAQDITFFYQTFYPYWPNNHKASTGCVWCAQHCLHYCPYKPPPLCYMTKGPPTKGCKMLMIWTIIPDGARAHLG